MRSPPAAARFLLAAAVLAGVPGWGGGLAAQPSSENQLRHEIVQLRRDKTVAEVENDRLRRIIARLEAELATARDRVQALETAARERQEALDREADAAAVLSSGPAVEEEELSDAELGDPAPDRDEEFEGSAEPPPTAASTPIDAAGQELYDESYTLFHEHRYTDAENGFRRFLERYPTSELADNAQFWMGECRYARREYEPALQAFLYTVEHYPQGNKVADALYKAGKCLEAMGESQKAVATYEEVVRRFPSSAAAVSSQERLAQLR